MLLWRYPHESEERAVRGRTIVVMAVVALGVVVGYDYYQKRRGG